MKILPIDRMAELSVIEASGMCRHGSRIGMWQLSAVNGCNLGISKRTEQCLDRGRIRQKRILSQKHNKFGIGSEALDTLLPRGTMIETGTSNGVYM